MRQPVTLLVLAAAIALAQLESFPGIADPSSASRPHITFTLPTVPINPPPTITRTLSSPTPTGDPTGTVSAITTFTAPVTGSSSSSSNTTPLPPAATETPPNAALALAPFGRVLLLSSASATVFILAFS